MKHLLVIGGTKGLGLDFCQSVSASYDRVSVLSRNKPGHALAGESIRHYSADALVKASLLSGLEMAVAAGGAVSHVVFFQQYRGIEETWDRKLACTLTATHLTLEFLREHFSPLGDKAVVFLTSIASRFVADEQDDGYHAAKTALLGLCRYYACALGALGVRVNCVSPGTVLKENSKHHFLHNPELHDLFKRIIPLRRMGTAAEVTAVIKFLLSSEASFVTGQEIIVDGGAGLRSQESLARALFNDARRVPQATSD